MKPTPLEVEATGAKDFGPCSCCGTMTRRVWGNVHRGEATEAVYFVEWRPGSAKHQGAFFDVIIGRWGEGASRSDRVAVSLEFRPTPSGPQFMVIDAGSRNVGASDLVGESLERAQVIGTPLADRAFAIVDAVWLHDDRISELRTVSA